MEETDNSGLQVGWQPDILHCRVDLVQFLLESICLSVQVLDEHSHVAEDVRVDYGTDGVREDNEEDLNVADWEGVVTGHH